MILKKYCSVFFIFFLTVSFSQIDKHIIYNKMTAKDGLPTSKITYLFKDSNNFLWISTYAGLCRFDGKKLDYFSVDINDPKHRKPVLDVIEIDENNFVARLTDRILFINKGKTYKSINFNLSKKSVTNIFKYKENQIGVQTHSANGDIELYFINSLNQNTIKNIILKNYRKIYKECSIQYVNRNYFILNQKLNDSLYYLRLYKLINNKLRFLDTKRVNNIHPRYINAFIAKDLKRQYYFEVKNDKIIIKIKKVDYTQDQSTGVDIDYNVERKGYFNEINKRKIYFLDNKKYDLGDISGNNYQSVREVNSLWLSSENGLYFYPNLNIEECKLHITPNSNDEIWSITRDNKHYYFASYIHGLYYSDLELKNVKKYNYPKGFENYNTRLSYGMITTGLGGVFVPSMNHILYIKENKTIYNKELIDGRDVITTIEDKKKHIIYFSNYNHVYAFDEKRLNLKELLKCPVKGMSDILDINFDKDGNIITVGNFGIIKIKKKGTIETLKDEKYSGVSIELDTLGTNWIGSFKGLYYYKNDVYKKINLNDSTKTILDLHVYKNKWLLIGYFDKLTMFNLKEYYKTGKIIKYDFEYISNFNIEGGGQNSFFEDKDGSIWWPVENNLLHFFPEKLIKNEYTKPPTFLYLECINNNNKQIISSNTNANNMMLDKKIREFTIYFSTPTFTKSKLLQYRVRLLGNSNNWEYLNDGKITYRNLSNGEYRFEMQSSFDGIAWSKSSYSLPIILKPFFYETLFFKIAIAIIILLLLTYLIKKYINKKQEDLLTKNTLLTLQQNLNAMQLDNLNKQLDPHEIKNILASISPEIQRNAPDAYNKMTKLLNLTRASLSSNSITDSIENQLQQIEDYLALEKTVLPVPLNYSIKNTVDTRKQIPRLLLKNLVENAIKHGIKNKKEGGEINIDLTETSNKIKISVDDTGIGRQQAISLDSGIGTSTYINLFETLNTVNLEKASFNIIDKQQGTKVEVFIPIDYKYS